MRGRGQEEKVSKPETIRLTEDLGKAEDHVKRAISRYKDLGSLPDNKLKAKTGLANLQRDIRQTMQSLKKNQTLRFRRSAKEAFKLGIAGGLDELAHAKWPQFGGLASKEKAGLARDMFALVDRDALDFLTNYSLVLAGDVQRDLADGIKRTILSGIALGKGPGDMVPR